MPERKAWTAEEDNALKYLREQQALSKWSIIAKKLAEEYKMLGRTGKQCRQRYHNHLDSMIMHSEWTREEEDLMYQIHDEVGNKWAIISKKLPGRTDNCVKNHFYSKLRKSIRKLNKAIHDYFKKEFKEIKITILYKLIEAADEKFKNSSSTDEEISENCCRLKRLLLDYSDEDQNQNQMDLQKVKKIIKEIYEFSSSYRRKPKRYRKISLHEGKKVKKKSLSFREQSQDSQPLSEEEDQDEVNQNFFKIFESNDRSCEKTHEQKNFQIEIQYQQLVLNNQSPMEQAGYYGEYNSLQLNENAHMFEEQQLINGQNFSTNLNESDEEENPLFI